MNNGEAGIAVTEHSGLRLSAGQVRRNAGDGVLADSASEVRITDTAITGNGAAGVSVGDLSYAGFPTSATVIGNLGGTDVLCGGQFSATRGALTNIGGGTTNCVEP